MRVSDGERYYTNSSVSVTTGPNIALLSFDGKEDASGEIVFENLTQYYDGNVKAATASATGVLSGATPLVTNYGERINPGSYLVYATCSNDGYIADARATLTRLPEIPDDETIIAPGWSLQDDYWYYADEAGNPLTGWQLLEWSGGTSWFYFDKYGVMLTGEQYLLWSQGMSDFYFDLVDGDMQTGWLKLGNWYFYDYTDGDKCYGWIYDSYYNGWFYTDVNDGHMLTGWQQLPWSGGTDWFYFYGEGVPEVDGIMAANTQTPDGYWVDNNGVWREGVTRNGWTIV
jgi:glucan-binding YG repeat protein